MFKGPLTAEVLVVGEAPGEQEERLRQPFVGASGQELDRMLREAGWDPATICFTNVCHVRPPRNDISAFFPKTSQLKIHGRPVTEELASGVEALWQHIARMPKLRLIIALGNTALWALTTHQKITKWRGSQLYTATQHACVPTYHPAAIFRQWDWRFVAVNF